MYPCHWILLKDKSGVGMVNATKESHHLLTQTLNVVSHFELSNACQVQECFDNLDRISFLCCHFRASAHDREAGNDKVARKQQGSLLFICPLCHFAQIAKLNM